MPPRRQNLQAVPAKRRPLRTRPGGLFVVSPSTRAKEPEAIFLRADWIFFDVSSTLIDETAAYNRRALEMLRGTDVSFVAFDRKRAEFFAQGLDGNSEAVRFFGLTKTPWHPEDERPFPDARETLSQRVSGRKDSQPLPRRARNACLSQARRLSAGNHRKPVAGRCAAARRMGATAVPRRNRRIGRAGCFQARPAHL